MIKKTKNYSAFSMVELMVAIFILSLITLTSVAFFANVAWARKNSLKLSKNIENGREAIQIMAKNIRMGSHLGPAGNTTLIYFFSEVTVQCVSYRFNAATQTLESAFQNKADASDEDCSPVHVGAYSYTPLTSTDMEATGSFTVKQTDTVGKVIGMATINMLVDSMLVGKKYSLETAISFRNYEGII